MLNNIEFSEIYRFIKSKTECSINRDNIEDLMVSGLIKLDTDNDDPTKLLWVNSKHLNKVKTLKTGILIAPNEEFAMDRFSGILIKCDSPRRVFSMILKEYFLVDDFPTSAKVNQNGIIIGEGTILEEGITLGEGVVIGYNNVILKGTVIGNNVKIGNNNTIGGVGFGYEKDEDGIWQAIPHIGNVVIEDDVEIGNNNCIDRAVLGSTILKKKSKVDNLTHISHGCIVGENALIIANTVLCGSSEVGDNSWVAPSTVLLNGKKIGKNCMTGLGSIVIKDVEDSTVVAGVPAKKLRNT